MTPAEATALTDFLKAAFPTMPTEQADVYHDLLLFEDAELASNAILNGIKEWKHPPRYAEIVERIRMERRAREPEKADLEPHLGNHAIPLWVRRWIAARYLHASFGRDQDMRRFPEQGNHGDPNATYEPMPDTEWIAEAAHVTDERVWKTILA